MMSIKKPCYLRRLQGDQLTSPYIKWKQKIQSTVHTQESNLAYLKDSPPSFRASICTFAPLSVVAYDSEYILTYCSIDYHFLDCPTEIMA